MHENARDMHRAKVLVKDGKMRKAASGGHDMVRRMDRQEEVLIDLVQKMFGLCETEQVGTKEYGKMLKRIQAP